MTSDELNAAISELDLESGWGDKTIPYMGWAWRDVDFDAPSYRFAVQPASAPVFSVYSGSGSVVHGPAIGTKYVAFCENNKWGYPYTRETTPEEWANIKALIERAVTERTEESFVAVKAAIHAIADGFDPTDEDLE